MEIEVVSPIEVQAEILQYTLVSDDIYIKQYDATNVPLWYENLINDLINVDPSIIEIRSLIDTLGTINEGYNIYLANLSNSQQSMYGSLQTLVAQTEDNIAAIAQLDLTKTTATEAYAISSTAVQAYMAGGASTAWFTSKISAYATEQTATASNVSALTAQVGNSNASFDERINVVVGQEAVTAGKVEVLSADVDGMQIDIESVDVIATTAHSWSASSAKFITNANGAITGWKFSDGSNTHSSFVVTADHFSIANGTTGIIPFTVDTVNSKIVMTGNVEINGSLSIKGGTVTTACIADQDITEGGKIFGPYEDEETMSISTVTVPGQTRIVINGAANIYGDMAESNTFTWTGVAYYPGGNQNNILSHTSGTAWVTAHAVLLFTYYNPSTSSINLAIHTKAVNEYALSENTHRHTYTYTLHKR